MNNRNLLIVAIAAAAALVGWFFSSGDTSSSFESEAMFEDLQKQLNEVAILQVESSAGVTLKAVKDGERWVAANKHDYPLEQDDVVQLLNAFATAELNDAKTSKAENYSRLGLQSIEQQDSQAALVTLMAGEKEWQVLVGNTSSSGSGVFVRKPDEAQSWLTRTELDLPADESDWLQTRILELEASDVVSISQQDTWSLQREARTVTENPEQPLDTEEAVSWRLSEMPAGRELKYNSVLENTADDILALRFEALSQLRPFDHGTLELRTRTVIETRTMGNLEISLYEHNDAWYAVYDAPELMQPAPDYHWQKWVYELSDFHAGRLTKKLDDFLTELPEEEETE